MNTKPGQKPSTPPSYALYILGCVFGPIVLAPIFFAVTFWALGGGTFGDGLGWAIFGAVLLFIPVMIFGFIFGWFIKYLNCRRTPAGQAESVLLCALAIMSITILSGAGELVIISVAIVVPTAAILSFLLPKPDPEE